MPDIKFIRDAKPGECDAPLPRRGDKLTVDQASADRWVRRGAAEAVVESPAPTKPKTTKKGNE